MTQVAPPQPANEVGFASKQQAALSLIEEALAVRVTNAEEAQAAGKKVEAVREFEKELEAEYKEHPTVVAAKAIQKLKGELAEGLEKARRTAKDRIMKWEDAEEEKRKEAERIQQAEAQKKADDEALAAAAAAEQAGDTQEAEAIISTPVVAPTVVLPKTTPKVAGHVRRMVPKFRIKNEAAVPRQFLKVDEVKVGGVVRSLKAAHGIPGVEFYEEPA